MTTGARMSPFPHRNVAFWKAIICKILDMGERRRRLIPIFLEPATTPVWLDGSVGIDAAKPDPLVDPFDRLKATLGAART